MPLPPPPVASGGNYESDDSDGGLEDAHEILDMEVDSPSSDSGLVQSFSPPDMKSECYPPYSLVK